MTEPTSSAAPVVSVVGTSPRQRLLLRLRRLVVSASWLPFFLLVVLVLDLDDGANHFSVLLVSLALMVVWPVVVIHNVARGRPPRWGPLAQTVVGLFNLLLAVVLAIVVAYLIDEKEGLSAMVLIVGGTASVVLFIAVLVRKPHGLSVNLVAALVSVVALLFLTVFITAMVEERPWRRWMPYVAEAPPHLDDDAAVMVAPPAPTPAPVIVAPIPAPVVDTPSAPSPEVPVVSPFEYGAESDCAVEVVDKARRVWLVGGRPPPCDWLVNVDDKEVCGDEDDAGIVHVEGHPALRISLVRQGQRVASHADYRDHTRQGALLRIDGAEAVRVIVHGFCVNGGDDADEAAPVACRADPRAE